MKDLEKIKSEDLGCQVQDANPGNFGIEQEVAAMVGATVPAPTEPSADDARELAAQLQVFLRRALLPIRSALRTALAAIYSHLDSRCTDYTPAAYDPFRAPLGPYDPMRPFVPRTLPNLLTAITAFTPRKISNGGATSDGIPDGISLAHLLLSADASAVTILKDDNPAWVYNRDNFIQTLCSIFPNMTRLEMNCSALNGYFWRLDTVAQDKALDIVVRDCKSIHLNQANQSLFWSSYGSVGFPNIRLWIYGLEDGANVVNCTRGMVCGEFYLPDFNKGTFQIGGGASYTLGAALHKVYVSCKGKGTGSVTIAVQSNSTVTDFEVEEGANRSINIGGFNGLTLDNILNHIALRLTDQGSGLTLTLSQAVFDTIWNQDGTPKSTDPDSVIYQINKIIKTDKHWSVNRA